MKNKDFEDDGRVIADMSDFKRPSFSNYKNQNTVKSSDNEEKLSVKNTFYYILGALKAAIIVGSIYAVVYFIVILVMWLLTK